MDYYGSPRITSEFCDCSMPITFDSYSNCGHNCAYCFSQYIRGTGPACKDYDAKKVKTVNVDRVKKIFTGQIKTPMWKWIEAKRPIQWGGLSDPFCPLEKQYGVGLELLKFFNDIEQPISFSSKGDLAITDERYLNEFKRAGNRWHYKASIITLDEEDWQLVERGTPTPQRRVEVLKRLHEEAGTLTTWRMRPFIVGVTDKTMSEMIKTAKEIGCQSITTEFFCLDTRGFGRNETLENYKRISQAADMSLLKFYKRYGTGSGYVRLDYNFLKPYVKRYMDECKAVGLPYFISDAKHKDKSCGGSCCGLLDTNEYFKDYAKFQMSNLIHKIKEKGIMTLTEAMEYLDETEKDWRVNSKVEQYMNLGSGSQRHKRRDMTYQDYFIKQWNGSYFQDYFEGVIYKIGKDEKGDAVYAFDYKKANI